MNMNTEKEARELKRLDAAANKPKPAHYMLLLMIVLTIVYVVDEITSNINSSMQPYILFDLFNITSRDVNSPEYRQAINTVQPLSVLSNLLLIISPFYKSLSDRFGRRIFLMINTLGMGLGMMIVMLAPNVVYYLLGMVFMMFFTPNDMQVLYIMETAPKEKRATYCFVTKAIALVSVSLIGVFSRMFLNDAVPSSWRRVYLIPVIVAIVVGLTCILFIRETPVFLDARRKYLRMSPQEREAKKAEDKKKDVSENGGVINAIKFILKNRQLRWIFFSGFIFYSTTVYTSYYATILEGAMSTAAVSTAMVIYPFFNGLSTMIAGWLSDKLGRKKACLVYGITTITGLSLFLLACDFNWGPVLAGIFYGVSIGGLWSMSDTLILTMTGESAPSSMRSSVMGTMTVMIGGGMFVGNALFIILQNFLPMATVCMIICLPFMVLSLVLLMTKVKETKGVDLETVTADTFN